MTEARDAAERGAAPLPERRTSGCSLHARTTRAFFFGREAEREIIVANLLARAADAALRPERRRQELAAAARACVHAPARAARQARRRRGARPVAVSVFRDVARRAGRRARGSGRRRVQRGARPALEPVRGARRAGWSRRCRGWTERRPTVLFDPRPVRGVLPLPPARTARAPSPPSCRGSSTTRPARELPDRDPRGRARAARPLQGARSRTCSTTTCASSTSTRRGARGDRASRSTSATSACRRRASRRDRAGARRRGARPGASRHGRARRAAGDGAAARRPATTRIETPYLQLVMTRLWEEERDAGSHVPAVETLDGARRRRADRPRRTSTRRWHLAPEQQESRRASSTTWSRRRARRSPTPLATLPIRGSAGARSRGARRLARRRARSCGRSRPRGQAELGALRDLPRRARAGGARLARAADPGAAGA